MTTVTQESASFLADVHALQHLQLRLSASETIDELLVRAPASACESCGFTRAVVLTVGDRELTVEQTGPVVGTASDELRRAVLQAPVPLEIDTSEHDLLRRRQTPADPEQRSILGSTLGLEAFAMAPIVAEREPVALLVVDRPGPTVTAAEREAVYMFGHILGLTLRIVDGRRRLNDVAREVQYLYASGRALVDESLLSPVVLSPLQTASMTYRAVDVNGGAPSTGGTRLLAPREHEVARLMVAGRSNREIANELNLSVDTIKGYVARVLRKLGAANRVEAVGRFMRLGET